MNKPTQYVSNTDKDIYTVNNIPEEVIAVIFAYVSRSPKSFRDNISTVIKEEQLGQERAEKFHEKWVLNYGHASVAEHASVHVGIENVSRLFSSMLELSNEYLSFTEYSQRYQTPAKGDFYTPVELDDNKTLKKEFQDLSCDLYDIYAELNDILFDYLKKTSSTPEGKDENSHHSALKKLAFEDARYALNLSTHTNLGMTGNARAVENAISVLLSSDYTEAKHRAEEIKQEVKFSIPTLIKYADEKKYITETRRNLQDRLDHIKHDIPGVHLKSVNLFNWTGKPFDNPQKIALKEIAKVILFEHTMKRYSTISKNVENSWNMADLLSLFKKTVKHLGKHDDPMQVFKLINYEAEFIISEACWHQLLRHRKVNWTYKEPSIYNGKTIPPNIINAGAIDLLYEAINKSETMFINLMDEKLYNIAPYVVTNAHNRRVIGKFDLWELYHLINLRMSEQAQWDIKNVIGELVKQVKVHHPDLVGSAPELVKQFQELSNVPTSSG